MTLSTISWQQLDLKLQQSLSVLIKKNGRILVAICNKEDKTTHVTNVQMLQFNTPCSTNCTHKNIARIFVDGNGRAWTKTCALEKQFTPIIQHDKARDMRNAVIHQNLESSLCNFYGLAAYREHI